MLCCSHSENELLKPLLFLMSWNANVLMTHIILWNHCWTKHSPPNKCVSHISNGHLNNTIFNLKPKTFYVFWPFIYTTIAFWGHENINFWKCVSEWKFLKTLLLLTPCKLRKREFVKMLTSCTCILLYMFSL